MSDPCSDEIMKKIPKADRNVVENFVRALREEKQKPFIDALTDPTSQFHQKANEIFDNYKKGLKLQEISLAQNILARKKNDLFIKQQQFTPAADSYNSPFAKLSPPGKAIEALLTGTNLQTIEGGSAAIGDVRLGIRNILAETFVRPLNETDLYVLRNGKHLPEVRGIWWDIEHGIEPSKDANPSHVRIARALEALQKEHRLVLNDSGAFVRDLKGRVGYRSHSPEKLHNVGPEKWKADLINNGWIDVKATENSGLLKGDINEILNEAYKNITEGSTPIYDKNSDNVATIMAVPGNMARKAEQGRKLIFTKKGDIEYSQHYGAHDSLADEIFASNSKIARQASLMRVLGDNPDASFARLLEDYGLRQSEKDYLMSLYDGELKGGTSIPGESGAAKFVHGYNKWTDLIRMGRNSLAQFDDLPRRSVNATQVGMGAIQSVYETIETFTKSMTNKQKRQWAELTGIYAEHLMGVMSDRFSGTDRMTGGIARINEIMFKTIGMTWLTETNKAAHGMMLSRWLGMHADLPLDKVNVGLRDAMRRHGITELDWDIARHSTETIGGKEFFSYSKIYKMIKMADGSGMSYAAKRMQELGMAIDENIIGDKLSVAGSESLVQKQIRLSARKIAVFFSRETAMAMNEPGDFERNILLRGLKADDPYGGAARLFAKYKTFPLTAMSKSMDRIMLSKGASTWREAANPMNGKFPLQALAHYTVYGTVMGYLSLAALSISNNEEPPKPDPTNPRLLLDAIDRGGAWGFFANLFKDELSSNYGLGAVGQLVGPVASDIWGAGKVAGHAVNVGIKSVEGGKEFKKSKENLKKEAVRQLVSHHPNYLWLKAIADYAYLDAAREYTSKGSRKRREKELRKEGRGHILDE